MYEHYITVCNNGLIDIELDINQDDFWANSSEPNPSAFTVTFTFAATTDSEAWLTIDGAGLVYPAFGGTGTTPPELDRYAEQCVQIWRAITDNYHTTCHYAKTGRDSDSPVRGDAINA